MKQVAEKNHIEVKKATRTDNTYLLSEDVYIYMIAMVKSKGIVFK